MSRAIKGRALSISRLALTRSISVFVVSLMACAVLLLIERLVGLQWDFHPDALHYIETSAKFSDNVRNRGDYLVFLNVGYYILVDALNSNIVAAIAFNITLFALTNSMIASIFLKYLQKFDTHAMSRHKRRRFYVFLCLILFDPYRVHLGISVLKDTSLLFLLVAFLSVRWKSGLLLIPLIASLRVIAPIYLFTLLKVRTKVYLALLIMAVFLAFLPFLTQYIQISNQSEMQVRNFDRIPTFQELGDWGALLRAVTWPIFYMSGSFLFLSPSALFVPIFFQVLVVMMFRWFYTNWKPWNTYFLLFGTALVVTGFTSYVRYALPILYFTILVEMTVFQPPGKKQHGL